MATAGIRTTWLAVTSVIVLFAADLRHDPAVRGDGVRRRAGGGPDRKAIGSGHPAPGAGDRPAVGASPIAIPSFGGVETPHLVLPVDRDIELHVTSLDVIHSFWARELGVKADANPGRRQHRLRSPDQDPELHIRCAELCGLFHGHMFQTGQVVSDGRFLAWISAAAALYAPGDRKLEPRTSPIYLPQLPRGGPDERGGRTRVRPWRGLFGCNVLTGIVLGVVGLLLRLVARATRSTRRPSRTSPTRARTTSP